MKNFIILLFVFISFVKAENHTVFYKGIEIGVIENLNNQLLTTSYIKGTIKDDYLRYLLLSDYFVIHKDTKPEMSNTFFKKNEKILSLLKMFLEHPEGNYTFEDKQLISTCLNNICSYKYFSKGIFKSEGTVLFNNKNIEIVYDETNNVLISSFF